MPYRFDVDSDAQVVTKTVWGSYDDEQALQSMKEFDQISGNHEFNELHDLTEVTSYDVSPATLKNLAYDSFNAEDQDFLPKRVAVVAPSDLVYGMTRIYDAYHEGSKEQIRVFRALEESIDWLNT